MPEGLESALPSVAPAISTEEARSLPLQVAPPMTWIAVVGCAGDLIISRVVLRTFGDSLSRDAFLVVDRWGAFSRNLAAVSALVALGFCLAAFGSRKSGLPLSGRVGLVGFGWAFVPIVALMTFLPLAWTRVELVLVVAGLAHALILLLILAGIHWRSTKPISAALGLLLVAFLSGIASLIVTLAGGRALWEHTERLAFAFRWSGELAFLTVPLVVALSLRGDRTRGRSIGRTLGALLAASLAVAGFFAWRNVAGDRFADLFYGAFRLDFFAEYGSVWWYVIPLAISAAVSAAALLSRASEQRELGAALFLLLMTGYAPRTPLALLTSVLAVALVARVALTVAHRRKVGSPSG